MSKRFVRWDSFKLKRLGTKWRKPRGRHNKQRLRKKRWKLIERIEEGKIKHKYMDALINAAYGKLPSIGRKKSKEERGKINGLLPKRVFNLRDLKGVDKDKEIVIIASQVGKKKRQEILNYCKENGIKVLN